MRGRCAHARGEANTTHLPHGRVTRGCRSIRDHSDIVGVAEEWDADLIVLGWHGRTAMKRFLFGSVATAVIHAASCSVELVRFRPERCESEACRIAERGES